MSTINSSETAAIFGRLFKAEEQISAELAQHILSLGFSGVDRDRINELAAKARAGILTVEDERELENFNLVGDLLAVWHSQARRAFNRVALASSNG